MRRWLRIGGLAFVALWGLAELVLRVGFYEQLKTRSYPLVYQPHPVQGYRYIPNSDGFLCAPSICKRFRINEHGYPGSSFREKKPDGVYRIAIAGGSDTTGIWLDGERDFASELARLFDEGDFPVEVINLSVDGNSRGLATLNLLLEEAPRFDIDLVILDAETGPLTTSNIQRDVYRDYVIVYPGRRNPRSRLRMTALVDRLYELRPLTLMYDVSYLVRAGVRWFLQHAPKETEVQMLARGYQRRALGTGSAFKTPSATATMLPRVHRQLARRGTRLVLMRINPDPSELPLYEFLPRIDVHYEDAPRFVHPHDGHPSELAHILIAEQVFARLSGSSWLREEGVQPAR